MIHQCHHRISSILYLLRSSYLNDHTHVHDLLALREVYVSLILLHRETILRPSATEPPHRIVVVVILHRLCHVNVLDIFSRGKKKPDFFWSIHRVFGFNTKKRVCHGFIFNGIDTLSNGLRQLIIIDVTLSVSAVLVTVCFW